MHQKNTMPTFGMFSEHAFAAQLCCKSEGFFRGRRRLLVKSAGFVYTQVSKTLCSFTYGSSGAAVVSKMRRSNGSGSANAHQFL